MAPATNYNQKFRGLNRKKQLVKKFKKRPTYRKIYNREKPAEEYENSIIKWNPKDRDGNFSMEFKDWTPNEDCGLKQGDSLNALFALRKKTHDFVLELKDKKNPHLFKTRPSDIIFGFQNGPAVLIDGCNPFPKVSKHTYMRTGMGFDDKGNVIVIATQNKCTFHAFSEAFKASGATNAIYLDGYPRNADAIGNSFTNKKPYSGIKKGRPIIQFFNHFCSKIVSEESSVKQFRAGD